jgi:hypothetical protein
MAFASLEGLPDMRADFGFGQVCATLANIHRREGQDPYQADDFMPGLHGLSNAEPAATKDADAAPDEDFDVEAHSRLISALLGKKE